MVSDGEKRSSKSAGNRHKAVTKAPREDAGSAADEVGQRLKGWVKIGVGDM